VAAPTERHLVGVGLAAVDVSEVYPAQDEIRPSSLGVMVTSAIPTLLRSAPMWRPGANIVLSFAGQNLVRLPT